LYSEFVGLQHAYWTPWFLPRRAIAMERYCHRMASVCPSVRDVGERWSHTLS